jgi:hypothetical protein
VLLHSQAPERGRELAQGGHCATTPTVEGTLSHGLRVHLSASVHVQEPRIDSNSLQSKCLVDQPISASLARDGQVFLAHQDVIPVSPKRLLSTAFIRP